MRGFHESGQERTVFENNRTLSPFITIGQQGNSGEG